MRKVILAVLLTLLAPFCRAYTLTPEIGGIKQVVEISTDDPAKPVLLFLSGGPGSSMMKNADAFTDQLKGRFTLVQWDQRDAGQTLKLNPSPVQPSLELMLSDTYQVIEFVRKELRQDKIYLLGSSWGNVLGFHIVRTHPELLHAYFAVNPVVSQLASEKALLVTLKAHFHDNADAIAELNRVRVPLESDEDMFYLRKWLFFKEGKQFVMTSEFKSYFMQWFKAWSPLWNEVMRIDLATSLPSVACPVYFLVGRNDIQTSTQVTTAYFDKLAAPAKALFVFEHSGHQIHLEEPVRFQRVILEATR
ncbi:alpha/beta fold hydrolase [Duganella sp. P38]|uniref:alpha/beta fold hydrolase n=1 Tax=Duganella sp. P38 TaxID=3423949 RepID=UPI003D7B713B